MIDVNDVLQVMRACNVVVRNNTQIDVDEDERTNSVAMSEKNSWKSRSRTNEESENDDERVSERAKKEKEVQDFASKIDDESEEHRDQEEHKMSQENEEFEEDVRTDLACEMKCDVDD